MIAEYDLVYDDEFFSTKLTVLHRYQTDPETTYGIVDKFLFLDSKTHLKDLAHEKMYILSCDSYGRLKGFYCLGNGDYHSVYLHTRELGAFLLLSGAEKAIMIHNHPNNDLGVSDDDVDCADKFEEICKMFQITYGGSFILAKDGYADVFTKLWFGWDDDEEDEEEEE